jgi:Raf kinase inhibitor-like YbhB/YbcL family protein
MAFVMKSSVIKPNQPIPREYTGDGEDISPDLSWSGAPSGTKEFALICEDPDAIGGKPFVHWTIYRIPATAVDLKARILDLKSIPGSTTRQGLNDFGRIGYNGPHPPSGKPHRYYFKLYSLSQKLELEGGATPAHVAREIHGVILEETHLMGTYQR